MTLIKTSVLNAISVAVRMLSMVLLNKILAVYAGPAGYAVIGQFQNAVQIFLAATGGAFVNGVTKYTAEYETEPSALRRLWQTATRVSLVSSLFCAVLIATFAPELSLHFLQTTDYVSVFRLFAATLVLYSLNTLLMAVINGKSEVVLYLQSSVIGSLVSVCITGFLAYSYGLYGALLALTIHQSITFFATLYLSCKKDWFQWRSFWGSIDKSVLKGLAGFALMAVTSAVCLPLTQIAIRDFIGDSLGWDAAGMWEGINKLSVTYLLFITSVLSLYYLPKLSKLSLFAEIKAEIFNGYKLILPLVMLCSIAVYYCRELIIQLLFSSEFLPMQELFAWQLTGDILKIGSWLIAFVMIGQAMTKLYIITELIFAASLYILTVWLLPVYGLEGAVMAYAVNYGLYWLVVSGLVFWAVKK